MLRRIENKKVLFYGLFSMKQHLFCFGGLYIMFKNWKIDKEKKRYLWKERVGLSINVLNRYKKQLTITKKIEETNN